MKRSFLRGIIALLIVFTLCQYVLSYPIVQLSLYANSEGLLGKEEKEDIYLPEDMSSLNATILYVGSSNIYKNGSINKLDNMDSAIFPLVKNGRTLVPVRFVSENLGAEVKWDSKNSTATINISGRTAKISPGKKEIYVNGNKILLDVAAENIRGRIFLPIRAVAEEVLNKNIFYENGLVVICDDISEIQKHLDEKAVDHLISIFESDFKPIEAKGGMKATIKVTNQDGSSLNKYQILELTSIINRRLEHSGPYGKNISFDEKDNTITIEVSRRLMLNHFNTKESLNILIESGILSLQEINENKMDEQGSYLPTNKIILDSSDIIDVQPNFSWDQGKTLVKLTFSEDGTKKFGDATERLIGKPIGVFLDSKLLVAPIVNSKIFDSEAFITLSGDEIEALELADSMKLGIMNNKYKIIDFMTY